MISSAGSGFALVPPGNDPPGPRGQPGRDHAALPPRGGLEPHPSAAHAPMQYGAGSPRPAAFLELQALRKSFAGTTILDGIDLALAKGEMLVIVGASGCGKSTLLRLVAGLEQPTGGRIVLDGRDVTRVDPAARDVAMVFQNYALYPHMSVAENMAYALRIRGMRAAERRARVEEAASLLGLEGLLDRRPRQLSGGQRQRVAMGRAIVRNPKLFLFDEPLSNLDAKLRVGMRAEIRRLQRRLGVTSLYVTHDQVEAMTLGDRLLVLHGGRPVQLATPMEVFEQPADTYVAGFIGAPAMNFCTGELVQGGAAVALRGGPVLALPARCGGAASGPVTVGIRPEDFLVGQPDGTDRGRTQGLEVAVELVEPLGSETLVHGRTVDGTALTARVAGRPPAGERLTLSPVAERLHLFDVASGRRLPAVAAP